MMNGHILLDNHIVEAHEDAPRIPPYIWILVAAAGAAVAAISLTDLVSLWIGHNLGNVDWEFDAIGHTFSDLLPATVGFALLGAGLLGREYRLASKALAIVFIGIGSFLVGLLVIYLIDAPGVAQSSLATGRPEPEVVKTAVLGSAYIVAYWWGVWFLKTRTNRMPTALPAVSPGVD